MLLINIIHDAQLLKYIKKFNALNFMNESDKIPMYTPTISELTKLITH